ncbi:MAG: histidine kinase dimerization/phospho-acceptor domain-containing protein [candidate division Zixibacteria bacterium]
MENRNDNRFEILRSLAMAGSQGDDLRLAAELALKQAATLLSLKAAAMYLWDDEMAVTLTVSFAESEEYRAQLTSMEKTLFQSLRQDKMVLSAYLSFGSEPQMHSFTQPVRHRGRILGAVIGMQEGVRTIVSEDLFVQALSAALSLNVLADRPAETSAEKELVDKERLAAIVEMAVTVNHEVNNPLTAILGNIQLLLMKHENLPTEVADKLRVVEKSAMQIRDVTHRLLQITSAKSVEYVEGTSMLKLPGDDEDEQ